MKRLRIGIDGYNLALPNGTGIATYGFMLAQALRAMGHQVDGVFGLDVGREPTVREAQFYDRLVRSAPASRAKRRIRRTFDTLGMMFGAQALDVPTGQVVTTAFADRLPKFDRLVSYPRLFERAHAYFRLTGRMATLRMANPPDIMHWTYPIPVRLEGARNIYTIHDVVPLRLPFTTLDEKQGYKALVEACIRAGDHICTVSEASRRDILANFSVPPEKVANTYQVSSMDQALLAEDPLDAARAVEGIFGLRHRGYFLFFGAIEPKKNLGRLIEAYLSLGTETPLVIVAGRSWQSERELLLLPREAEEAEPHHQHLVDRIIRIDYLPRHLLMRLARGARAVTFPSLYEGFGLPAHEAMLLGAPVLSSTTGSIPEIAGDAALLADPYDVTAIADALRRLDCDSDLRAKLAACGPVQAQAFSMDRYRERLTIMYNQSMGLRDQSADGREIGSDGHAG